MSPEYGATCGFFPVDDVTLDYLRLTGRSPERIALVEAYCKENLLWHDPSEHATYSEVVELDLGRRRAVARRPARGRRTACRSRARRRRSSRRSARSASTCATARTTRRSQTRSRRPTRRPSSSPAAHPSRSPTTRRSQPRPPLGHKRTPVAGTDYELDHGSVVIAAITSCTNTSNPQVMVAAGLLARNAVERGLHAPAVGQVVARARLEGRHALLRAGGPAGAPRHARLQHGRLRLHDVHRQLRPARRRDRGSDRRGRPRRLLGALGQPQLRGAHPSRGEGELPRLAAARRRLFARRPHGHRLGDRADRHRLRRRGRLPARHLAERAGGQRHDRHLRPRRALLRHLRRRLHRRRAVARPARAGRRAASRGRRTRPTSGTALLRRHEPRAGLRRRHRRARACSCGSATR